MATLTKEDVAKVNICASREMCEHCFDSIIKAVRKSRKTQSGSSSGDTPKYMQAISDPNASTPLFVTWEIRDRRSSSDDDNAYQLRGCIGSLEPRPLSTAIQDYAIHSGLYDRRFNPISEKEIPYLRVSVSLLVKYEECCSFPYENSKDETKTEGDNNINCLDWTVGVHGILINFRSPEKRHYSATFLPEVAKDQGWTQKETLFRLIQKSGYGGRITLDLLRSIRCTRYQSSKVKLTFEEYLKISQKI